MKTILDIARSAKVSKITVRRYIEKENIKPYSDGRVFLFEESVADAIFQAISKGEPVQAVYGSVQGGRCIGTYTT